MTRLLKNILSFILVGAILFASTGVVIASHVCSETKKADVSMFERKGCCSKPMKGCSSFPSASDHLKNNCCQLSITYHKLNISSLQKTTVASIGFFLPFKELVFQTTASTSGLSCVPEFRKPPVQKTGKDFLIQINLLLI